MAQFWLRRRRNRASLWSEQSGLRGLCLSPFPCRTPCLEGSQLACELRAQGPVVVAGGGVGVCRDDGATALLGTTYRRL